MSQAPLPELYFATVKAMGTDLSVTTETLSMILTDAGYHVPEPIRLSHELKKVDLCKRYFASKDSSEFRKRNGLMTAGDAVRTFVSPDAVALLGIRRMKELRIIATRNARSQQMRGIAWIFQSLMHEPEVSTLRDLLGDHFFVISVFSDEVRRRGVTRRQLGPTQSLEPEFTLDEQVDDIHARDQGRDYRFVDELKRREVRYSTLEIARLGIEDTFYTADLFLDGDRDVNRDIERFVRQIFSDPFGVASKEEVGMAHAFTAGHQSSAMSRRVGASLTVADSLICTGRNDLPQAGGGQQDSDTSLADTSSAAVDPRQATIAKRRMQESTASEEERADMVRDLLTRLFRSDEWLGVLGEHLHLDGNGDVLDPTGLIDRTLQLKSVRDSRIYDLIEFNPTVHAEMSAITTAARMGFSVAHGTLYTTTFPCHECTRHIISSGITSVVYLEPYAKSRAEKLFADQIRLSRERSGGDAPPAVATLEPPPVDYLPFMGIAPRRHAQLFSWLDRKPSAGNGEGFHLDAESRLRKSIEAPISDDRAIARIRARHMDQGLAIDALEADLKAGGIKMRAALSRTRPPNQAKSNGV